MRPTLLRCATGLGIALAASAALAQGATISPGAIQQREEQERERRQQEERLRQPPATPGISVPAEPPRPAEPTTQTIRVERVRVDASQILPKEKIDAIISPLEGRTVTVTELQQAIDAINALYKAGGHATSRAILPPQTITEGEVRIRLVEARVGEVRLKGVEALDPGFVTERVRLEAGELLSVARLESDLVRFNRLHETRLSASLAAGRSFGTTDVELTAVEPGRHAVSLFFDNAGNDTVGEGRGGLDARLRNLLGRSDALQFVATRTEGAENYALSYSVPLTRNDLRLELSASDGHIRIVDGPFEPLDITGQSSDVSAGLTLPLHVSLQEQWSLYGRLSARESVSKFDGVELEAVDLHIVTLGIAGEHQDDDSAWYIDGALSNGTTMLGADSSFTTFRASGTRFDRVGDDMKLLLRGGLQLSAKRVLPASELYQIGGAYTVRGFSEGLLSGRNGYFVSAELRTAGVVLGGEAGAAHSPVLQGLVFLDHGGALPYRPGDAEQSTVDDYLTSAGIGMLFEFPHGPSGRLVIAQPLRSNPAELHDRRPRVHASITIPLN